MWRVPAQIWLVGLRAGVDNKNEWCGVVSYFLLLSFAEDCAAGVALLEGTALGFAYFEPRSFCARASALSSPLLVWAFPANGPAAKAHKSLRFRGFEGPRV